MTEQNRLGKLGEVTLELWALTQGINPQRVRFDETGWDYVLEFEPEPATDSNGATLPADRWPPPLRCTIQVKATSLERPSRPMRLKNLLLLATNPQPAFVLLLRYVNRDVVGEAFLFTIDQHRVLDTLKRVRFAFRDGKDLASLEVDFTGDSATRIEPTPAGLEAGIRAHVGASMTDYMAEKLKWITNSGYEDGRRLVSFEIDTAHLDGMSLEEYWIEVSLGVRPPIPIKNVVEREMRFGIESGESVFSLPEGTIEIDLAPMASTVLSVRCRDRWVDLSMKVLAPNVPPGLVPQEAVKFRLLGTFLDLVIGNTGMRVTFTLPQASAKMKLKDFRAFATFALIADESARFNAPVYLSLDIDGRRLRQTISLAEMPSDPPLLELSRLMLKAWSVAKYFDVHEMVELTIEDLLQSRIEIDRIFYVVEQGQLNDLEFSASQLIDPGAKPLRVLMALGLTLGGYDLALVAAVDGSFSSQPSPDGLHSYRFTPASRTIERAVVGDPDGQPLDLDAIVREARLALGDACWLLFKTNPKGMPQP